MRGFCRFISMMAAIILLVGVAWADASGTVAGAGRWKPEISLPSLIGDHMVIQRDMPAPVWGKTVPKARVTVKIGEHTARTRADADGRWQVEVGPLDAGGPYEMTIGVRRSKAVVSDILAGDVWVCSGQSNMQWPVKQSNNPDEEIRNASHPAIRLYTVERTVSGEPLEGCKGQWTVCSPETIPDFSAVAYYFGRRLQEHLGVPIGLVNTSWGGTPAEAWTSMPTLQANPEFAPILQRWEENLRNYPAAKAEYDKAMEEWQKAAEAAKAKGEPEPRRPGAPMGPDHPWRAAGLYNGMIAPLIPFGISGAIWYQGESNAGRAYQYRSLFPAMITDWRKNWGQGDFPFFFVQLANFMETKEDASAGSAWAELREAQTMTLSLPKTGMAVIIDIGDANDIHPRNKQDVGARLAQSAFKVAYGIDCAYEGPLYESMRVDGGAIRVKFRNTFGGLKNNNAPNRLRGFALAGADKNFHWANATIEGDEVVVSTPDVAQPVAVRYAWADNPICDLYNGAGLPASPFRTDDWPGVTMNEK